MIDAFDMIFMFVRFWSCILSVFSIFPIINTISEIFYSKIQSAIYSFIIFFIVINTDLCILLFEFSVIH